MHVYIPHVCMYTQIYTCVYIYVYNTNIYIVHTFTAPVKISLDGVDYQDFLYANM